MTRKRDSSHVYFVKICFHKYANLHMTERSQHRIPHVVFVILIGDEHVNVDEAADPSIVNQDLSLEKGGVCIG